MRKIFKTYIFNNFLLRKIGIETLDLVKIKKKNFLIFVPNATLFPSVLEVCKVCSTIYIRSTAVYLPLNLSCYLNSRTG